MTSKVTGVLPTSLLPTTSAELACVPCALLTALLFKSKLTCVLQGLEASCSGKFFPVAVQKSSKFFHLSFSASILALQSH